MKRWLRPISRPLRELLRKRGYDIVSLPAGGAPADVRMRWIDRLDIDLTIDVGANKGHFRRLDARPRLWRADPLLRAAARRL